MESLEKYIIVEEIIIDVVLDAVKDGFSLKIGK